MRLRAIAAMAAVLVALGVLYALTRGPPSASRPDPRPVVWSVEMRELERIAVNLPRDGKGEAWVKREDKQWYFDRPDGPKVDAKRWGGGVPLILSGPAAERRLTSAATAAQLEEYGLARPRMTIHLALESGRSVDAEVGDTAPGGQACYVRVAGSGDVYTVHLSWYEVLERLVLEPPYPQAE